MRQISKSCTKRFFAILLLISFSMITIGSDAFADSNNEAISDSEKNADFEKREQNDGTQRNFEKILDDTEKYLIDISAKLKKGKNVKKELNRILQNKIEIEEYDYRVRRKFKETEIILQSANTNKGILRRHSEFVKAYNENHNGLLKLLEKFLANFHEFEKEKQSREILQNSIISVLNYLDERKCEKAQIQFNPQKLPYRSLPERQFETEDYKKYEEKKNKIDEGNKKENIEKGQMKDFMNPFAMIGVFDVPLFLFGFQPPDSEYLEETMEVQFTDDIIALAEEFHHSPVEIYEYVKNNFDYEPYYGSLKGAQQTLSEGAGNDFDLASLLIALLRASGIHARYARGDAIIPIEKAMVWLRGVKSPDLVGKILATNGISGTYLQSGGKIVAIKLDHVWVEAYVDYEPSRGAVHKKGDTWIPLDPSFKTYFYVQGIDISQEVVFDEDEYLDTLRMESPLDFYMNKVREYFEAYYPDTSFFAGVSGAAIDRKYLGILPASLPYRTENRENFAEVSDPDRHKVDFEFTNLFGNIFLSYSAKTPEIAGEGIALFYKPASVYDKQLIEQYDGLYNVPAYLLTLKPSLRIGGAEITQGSDIGFGEKGVFRLTIHNPSGFSDWTEHPVTVGAWYGITLNLQKVPGDVMTKVSDELIPLLEEMDLSDSLAPVVIEPEWAERMLNEFGLGYFSMLDASEHIFAGFNDIVLTKYISECLTAFNVSVEYLYGMPYDVDQTGMLMDAAKVILNPFNRNGLQNPQKHFQILTGFEGSYWEHNLFELWLRLPSVSAVKALEIANTENIPIYLINSGNINQIMPLLELPVNLKEEIQNSVNADFEVKVSQREIQFLDWTGAGYIIRDPETGAGAFKISVGYYGGGSGGSNPINNGSISWVLNINKRGASICLGEIGLPPIYEFLEDFAVLKHIEEWLTYRALFKLGYNISSKWLHSEDDFLDELKKPNNKVLYYGGHSDVYGFCLQVAYIGVLKPIALEVSYTEIQNTEKPDYLFVFINGCYTSNYLIGSFGSSSAVGWDGAVAGWSAVEATYYFWEEVRQPGKTVGDGWRKVTEYISTPPFLLYGDPNVSL